MWLFHAVLGVEHLELYWTIIRLNKKSRFFDDGCVLFKLIADSILAS